MNANLIPRPDARARNLLLMRDGERERARSGGSTVMPVHNADIAAAFDEIAELLEIDEANPFRVRAYRNAARSMRDLRQDVHAMVTRGESLSELPFIGKDLGEQIERFVRSGHCERLEELRGRLPHGLVELLAIPGLGPKRVRLLSDKLDVHDMQQLAKCLQDGRIAELKGFGAKTLEALEGAIAGTGQRPKRFLLATAADYAIALVEYLRKGRGAREVVVAGSYRRGRDTVGDLDVLVCAEERDAARLSKRFVRYDEVQTVLAHGATRSAVALRSGLHVDMRIVPPVSYGAALHYFTGSKAHNIAIRKLGLARGLKINEYGVFKGTRRVAGETEQSVYASVGLPYIPPELREDRGEVQAARNGTLPVLIETPDLRGDLHAHTRRTDGRDTLESMARAAVDLGYEYLAITEHSRQLSMTHGLDPRGVIAQGREIDRLGRTLHGITLLKGIEVDILEDGSLDLPDEVLAQLDVVIAAVHSHFKLSRAAQTARVIRALANPFVTMLAHPSCRLIGERESLDIDLDRVIRAAARGHKLLEIDSQPDRMDLDDVQARAAKDAGVRLAVDTDAHSVLELEQRSFGIEQARRAWLTRDEVVNTLPLPALREVIARTRGAEGTHRGMGWRRGPRAATGAGE